MESPSLVDRTQKIKKLIEKDCTVSIEIAPDPEPPSSSTLDESLVSEIEQDMQHNEWAWCLVTVGVQWRGVHADESLGGCSYKDEESFRVCDYFAEMKEAAILQIANKIDRILFNILEDIAREGLEPNEAFDGAYLESWLRDRGWIHD